MCAPALLRGRVYFLSGTGHANGVHLTVITNDPVYVFSASFNDAHKASTFAAVSSASLGLLAGAVGRGFGIRTKSI